MNVIECSNVIKKYGRKKALNDLSLQIQDHSITGIIGRNGAGKTTLMKILSGYMKHSSGDVFVFGGEPFNSLNASQNTMFVHSDLDIKNVMLRDLLRASERFYPNWNRTLAIRLLDHFSFSRDQMYSNLSKGMKSTFHMIIAICARTPLTLLDEPTLGMDAAVRKDFYKVLLKEYIAFPRTILISSHHLEEIEDLIDHIVLIDDGKCRLHLPIEDLKLYALALQGQTEQVSNHSEGREILFSKNPSKGSLYRVVKNDFTSGEKEHMKSQGIRLLPVSATDICVYLTSSEKGEIDDVFREY